VRVAYNSAYAENMAKVHVDRQPTDLKTAISEAMEPILQKYAQENKKAAIVVEPTSNLTFDATGKATIKLTYKADGATQTGTIKVSDVTSSSDISLKAEQATFSWGTVTASGSSGESSSVEDVNSDLINLRSYFVGKNDIEIWAVDGENVTFLFGSEEDSIEFYLYKGNIYTMKWEYDESSDSWRIGNVDSTSAKLNLNEITAGEIEVLGHNVLVTTDKKFYSYYSRMQYKGVDNVTKNGYDLGNMCLDENVERLATGFYEINGTDMIYIEYSEDYGFKFENYENFTYSEIGGNEKNGYRTWNVNRSWYLSPEFEFLGGVYSVNGEDALIARGGGFFTDFQSTTFTFQGETINGYKAYAGNYTNYYSLDGDGPFVARTGKW